jgi:hypothetical protein
VKGHDGIRAQDVVVVTLDAVVLKAYGRPVKAHDLAPGVDFDALFALLLRWCVGLQAPAFSATFTCGRFVVGLDASLLKHPLVVVEVVATRGAIWHCEK